MDNREKIYEHGGELGNVQDLFEITANHVHYLSQLFKNIPDYFVIFLRKQVVFESPIPPSSANYK